MRKREIISMIVIGLMASCSYPEIPTKGNPEYTPRESYISFNTSDRKTVELEVDLEREEQLQAAVDEGHQPWRCDPVSVAYVSVRANIEENVQYSNCQLLSAAGRNSEVLCQGNSKYLIHLKRLVRPDGIWTATSIEIIR